MACHRYEYVSLNTSSEVCDGYGEEISPSDVAKQRIEQDRVKREEDMAKRMQKRMMYEGT